MEPRHGAVAIIPCNDLDESQAFYERLGFEATSVYPAQGYRIMLVKLQGNKAVSYTPFSEGWLRGVRSSTGSRTIADAWGRPADVLVMPDGSLLIADDEAGVIYRVTYKG